MYDLPSMKNVTRVVVEENVINDGVDPLLIYEDAPRAARSKARKG
jgi:ATP-dependent Clp protease ATP-binding subunit ClpX